MVFLALKPSFFDASCCIVEVVKGGNGHFLSSFFSTERTLYSSFFNSSQIFAASCKFLISSFSNFLPSFSTQSAIKSFLSLSSLTFIVQYSSDLKFWISLSRSTISLTATDWTLPAERPA